MKKVLVVLAISALAVLVVYMWLPIFLDAWDKKYPESRVYYGDRSSPVTERAKNSGNGVTVLTGDTEKKFSVQPKTLKKGDVLKITLPNVHPKYLAIEAPGGRWIEIENYFIDLTKKNEVILPVNEQKGIFYDPETPGGKTVMVFTQPGRYRLYFADNLETERENTFYLEETVYFNKK